MDKLLKTLRLVNKLVHIRFYVYIVGIVLVSVYFNHFFDIALTKDAYFWVLSSLVQGFSAFFGIVIALVALSVNNNSKKRTSWKKLAKRYFIPVMLVVITITFSIMGMVAYPLFKDSPELLSQIIIIGSFFSIMSLWEIFVIAVLSIIRE